MNPYEEAGATLLRESGCTVRSYRLRNTGRGWVRSKEWAIEVPSPRGPVSFAVFAHEVAHQLLHRHGSRPRWLEEVEAWEWALEQFERFDLDGVERARERASRCLHYSIVKALRRCTPETAAAMVARLPRWTFSGEAWAEIEEAYSC